MSLLKSFTRPVSKNLFPSPVTGEYLDGGKSHQFGGSGNVTLLSDQIFYSPFYVTDRIHVVALAIAVTVQSGTGGAKARLALYANGTDDKPGALIVDAGEVAIDSTGKKDSSAIDIWLSPDTWVYRAINASATGASILGYTSGPAIAKRTDPTTTPLWGMSQSFAYAAMPANATPPTTGANVRPVLLKLA